MNRASVSTRPFFGKLADFFLPRLCAACEKGLEPDEKIICGSCFSKIKFPEPSFLRSEFRKNFEADGLISDFASLFLFQKNKPVQFLLHDLKYRGMYKNGLFIGSLLAEFLEEKIKSWDAEIIIPVPLHKLKIIERGYNQSYSIAWALSQKRGIPLDKDVLARTQYTETQTFLNAEERRKNLAGVFKTVKPGHVKGKKIILIDDIITTGATLNECALVLRKAGSGKIFALSAAIAE